MTTFGKSEPLQVWHENEMIGLLDGWRIGDRIVKLTQAHFEGEDGLGGYETEERILSVTVRTDEVSSMEIALRKKAFDEYPPYVEITKDVLKDSFRMIWPILEVDCDTWEWLFDHNAFTPI